MPDCRVSEAQAQDWEDGKQQAKAAIGEELGENSMMVVHDPKEHYQRRYTCECAGCLEYRQTLASQGEIELAPDGRVSSSTIDRWVEELYGKQYAVD